MESHARCCSLLLQYWSRSADAEVALCLVGTRARLKAATCVGVVRAPTAVVRRVNWGVVAGLGVEAALEPPSVGLKPPGRRRRPRNPSSITDRDAN